MAPLSTTDEHRVYVGIDANYAHKQVNHAKGEYVSGDVYTNGIENCWSLLKRSIKGTQIRVSPTDLDR
jgi:hypothetical protein